MQEQSLGQTGRAHTFIDADTFPADLRSLSKAGGNGRIGFRIDPINIVVCDPARGLPGEMCNSWTDFQTNLPIVSSALVSMTTAMSFAAHRDEGDRPNIAGNSAQI